MDVYLPEKDKDTSAAVVICNGGGYQILAMDKGGYNIAQWLAERVVAGIVLKYTMPNGHQQILSGDARQAMHTVRAYASECGIDPAKVEIAGSSAGGHLASTVGTRFDPGNPNAADPVERYRCRRDFMLLLYPVISFREEIGHIGSCRNLIGEGCDWKLVQNFSNKLHFTAYVPPAFLVLPDDDSSVVPRNTIKFYSALKDNYVPAVMHIFLKGGHGFGMRNNNSPTENWQGLNMDCLKISGFMTN